VAFRPRQQRGARHRSAFRVVVNLVQWFRLARSRQVHAPGPTMHSSGLAGERRSSFFKSLAAIRLAATLEPIGMQQAKGISTAPKEIDVLQEIAREATRIALDDYEPMPDAWKENLTLGTFFDGDDRIFELYIAAERPAEATVISSARVNRKTKSVEVTISNLTKKCSK
jgi:hypothetical protein